MRPPPCCAPRPHANPAAGHCANSSASCPPSPEFRDRWAAHDVLIRHDGVKRLQHPEDGHLELTFQDLDLPLSGRAVDNLITRTAEKSRTGPENLHR
ncbi:MmyB family transcriptional regulator [Nocardia noduli]|uniref:MmyB family transcriptional regulator n=1 Tax=Nocardia noduli TaxID=2815722 RepID=UPI001C22E322